MATQHGGFHDFDLKTTGKVVSTFGPQTRGMISGWHVLSLLGQDGQLEGGE